MNENQKTSRDDREEPWKERAMYASPGLIAALLWTFTALRYRPGISFLLVFGVLLTGVALFGYMALRWGRGRSSSKTTLVGCASGVLLMLYGGVELAFMPEGPPGPARVLILLLLVLASSYWRRVVTDEKSVEPQASGPRQS